MSFNFSPKIVTNDLIFYVDAANTKSYISGSTIWYDLDKNPSYDITFFNGVGFDSSNNGSIRFDGTDDYANRTFTSGDLYDINLTGEITLDIWIKWDNVLRSSESAIAFGRPFGDNTSGQYQWQFIKSNNGAGQFRGIFAVSNTVNVYALNQITNDGFFNPNTPIQNNTWYNFLYTYKLSNGDVKGYVNGEDAGGTIVGTNPASLEIPVVSHRFLSIGAQSNPAGFFSMLGNIGSIKIYNRILSEEEIKQNYNAIKSRYRL
jgi:hypothetical protein